MIIIYKHQTKTNRILKQNCGTYQKHKIKITYLSIFHTHINITLATRYILYTDVSMICYSYKYLHILFCKYITFYSMK